MGLRINFLFPYLFLKKMENNYDKFLSYINVDIRNNKKVAYKNNRTFRAEELIEKFTYKVESIDREALYRSLDFWTTLSDVLCYVVCCCSVCCFAAVLLFKLVVLSCCFISSCCRIVMFVCDVWLC